MKKLLYVLIFTLLISSVVYGQNRNRQFKKGQEVIIKNDTTHIKQTPSQYKYDTLNLQIEATPGNIQINHKDSSYVRDSLKADTTKRIDAEKTAIREKAMNVGIKGGLNFPSMSFKGYVTPIDNTFNGKYEPSFKTSFAFGIFAELKSGTDANYFSLQPEFLFVRRGFDGDYVKDDNDSVFYNFEQNINYLEGRFSFLFKPFAFIKKNWDYIHLSLTSYFGFVSETFGAGNVYEKSIEYPDGLTERLKIGKNGHINGFDIGVGLGLGLKIPIKSKWLDFYICTDVSYDMGLLDNHPIREIETGNPARYNRGVLATLGLSIPIYQPRQKTETIINSTAYHSKKMVTSIERIDTIKQSIERIAYQTDTIKILTSAKQTDTIETTITKTIEIPSCRPPYIVWFDINSNADNYPNPCDSTSLILIPSIGFEHSKSNIVSDMETRLVLIANLLNTKYKEHYIEIYAHTDSSGSSGFLKANSTVFNNDSLSDIRVAMVADFLEKRGVKRDRIVKKAGYSYKFPWRETYEKYTSGNNNPIPFISGDVPDNSARGIEQKNRRTEIYIKCNRDDKSFYGP